MIAKCIANTGDKLSSRYLETGYLETSAAPLVIGDSYVVYGMNMFRERLSYLTMDKYNKVPGWYPAEWFEVVDKKLPKSWYYNFFGLGSGLDDTIWRNAIWGYEDLVLVPNHYEGLAERRDDALLTFWRRKIEIDKESLEHQD